MCIIQLLCIEVIGDFLRSCSILMYIDCLECALTPKWPWRHNLSSRFCRRAIQQNLDGICKFSQLHNCEAWKCKSIRVYKFASWHAFDFTWSNLGTRVRGREVKYSATSAGTTRVLSGTTRRKIVGGRRSVLRDIGVLANALLYSILLNAASPPFKSPRTQLHFYKWWHRLLLSILDSSLEVAVGRSGWCLELPSIMKWQTGCATIECAQGG